MRVYFGRMNALQTCFKIYNLSSRLTLVLINQIYLLMDPTGKIAKRFAVARNLVSKRPTSIYSSVRFLITKAKNK